MTYFDCVCVKNNEIYDSEPFDQVENTVAYRVPKDAERALFVVMNPMEGHYVFKSADHVFGGKDLEFSCNSGYHSMYVDINTMIQRSGEHEGCILIEFDGDSCLGKLFVFEN